MLYTGVVFDVPGQSRFSVFFYSDKNDIESGRLLPCSIRHKLKTRYRFSQKRLARNSIVEIEYDPEFDVGCIVHKYTGSQAESLRKTHNLPLYDLQD